MDFPELTHWAAAGRQIVHEIDTKRLLKRAGIAVPEKARGSGTCAVKLSSDRFPHKSDHGLICLGVPANRVEEIAAQLQRRDPDGEILIEEMIEDGVAEWIIGCRHDPVFGPIIVCGPGGIFVELLDTACIRLAPLGLTDAHRAILRYPQAAKLLQGVRGKPHGDVDALALLIERVSQFFVAHADSIAEIEINPVIVRPLGRGAVAADALMTLRCRS